MQLVGMKEICAHMKRSECTVRKLIRLHELPAVKIEGEWISDSELINVWLREKIKDRKHGKKKCPQGQGGKKGQTSSPSTHHHDHLRPVDDGPERRGRKGG